MSDFTRTATTLVLALCLAGCGGAHRRAPESGPLPILLSPWMPGAGFAAYQQVNASRGGREYYFESAVEFTSGELRVIMLGELGQRMATIGYNGADLMIDKADFLPDAFDPRHVLEAMQMIYWPLEAYADRLVDGWRLVEQDNRRSVYYQGRLAAEIEYDTACPLAGEVRYYHRIYDFQLSISSALIGAASQGQVRPTVTGRAAGTVTGTVTGKDVDEPCPI